MSKTEMEYIQDLHIEHFQGTNVLYTVNAYWTLNIKNLNKNHSWDDKGYPVLAIHSSPTFGIDRAFYRNWKKMLWVP